MSENLDIRPLDPSHNPLDTVQEIIWSQSGKMFATGDWGGQLRIYSVNDIGYGSLSQAYRMGLGEPILALAWDEVNNIVFVGLADGTVKTVHLATSNVQNVMELNAPVCKLFWQSKNQYLITIPFDKHIILTMFDPPNQRVINIEEKMVTADLHFPYLLIATSNQYYGIINLTSNTLTKPKLQISPLEKHGKITTVCISGDYGHIGIGTFEGRGAFIKFDKTKLTCDKPLVIFKTQYEKIKGHGVDDQTTKLFYTSSLNFHPIMKGKMLCCGGQSTLAIYDYENKTQHKKFAYNTPLSIAKFSPDGNYFAYALGSLWQYGLDEVGLYQPKICVHKIQTGDLGLNT